MPVDYNNVVPTAIDPNRKLRPLEPGEAETSDLYKQAWAYAQKFPVGDQPAASMTWLVKNDPSFKVPSGYKQNSDGTVEVDRGSWLARNWSYLALAAVTGAIGLSFLPPAAAASAVPGVSVAPEAAAGGLGGVEAGVASGLGPVALPGAGTALPGIATAGGYTVDAAGNVIDAAGVPSEGGGILDAVKKYAGVGDILKTVGDVGQTLGAAGKGAADARMQEALINQRQDALGLQRYTDQLQGANTDLAQKRFQLQAPAQRESNAVRGDILANAKDFSYGAPTMVGNIPVPTSSGGLRPSIFSADTKNLGSTIARQSNQAQQSGDVFDPLPQIPGLTPLPQAGASDSILNTAGTVGNLSELLSKLPYGKIATMFGR